MFFSPRKRIRRSSVGIEQLEVRIVPTVSVTQNGGRLTITGDSSGVRSADNVTITGADPGEVDVTHDGTTESFTDVTDITVNTKRGSDTVTIVDLDIEGDLAVNTGDGQDTVSIRDSQIGNSEDGGDLSVNTGAASDKATLDTITVGGITSVKLGDRRDMLIVGGSTFEGNFTADGGKHSDSFDDDGDNTFMGRKIIKHFQRLV